MSDIITVMVKIWFKTHNDKRITQAEIYHYDGKFDTARFDEYVRFACHEMDIPTPVVLDSHIHSFVQFNICKFDKTDFVESTDFEQLTLENCPI